MAQFGEEKLAEAHPKAETRKTARLWPFILTTTFGIVFMGIADLAWLTAIGTTEAWFTSALSAQTYTATLTSATLATLILASLAASRIANLESRVRDAVAEVRPREAVPPPEVVEPVVVPTEARRDPDGLDQILNEIGRFAAGSPGPLIEVREKPAVRPAPPVRLLPDSGASNPREQILRLGLRRARRLIWQTVLGPLVMLLIFLAISGAMLPGSGEFAQTHFQLNTGIILFLTYGWPFLVTWTIAAIVVLQAVVRLESDDLGVHPAELRPRRWT